jgi:hypothetical protein
MARLRRLPSIPFGWYYVALHSVANKEIVGSHEELVMALIVLRATLRRRGAHLHAGYLAEHEMHLALQVSESPLSTITGGFAHEYARQLNLARGEHGVLFRAHHRVVLFQHQRWLVPLVHYIHWVRRLERPDNYLRGVWWSSDATYGGRSKQHWVTTNAVLRMLSPRAVGLQARREAYRIRFDTAPSVEQVRLITGGSAEDPRLLGDADFIAEVRRRMGSRLQGRISKTLAGPSGGTDIAGEIARAVCQVIERFKALCDERLAWRQADMWKRDLTVDAARSQSRRRPLPLVRALCTSRLIERQIASSAEAARFFGCSPRAVSARRRRHYAVVFHEWFGEEPQALLWAERGGRGFAAVNIVETGTSGVTKISR